MKIANIYSLKSQSMYRHEDYVMLLAHLLDKYDPNNFNEKQYVILDNGMFEKSMVSADLKQIIDLADNCAININEIIIPDVMHNKNETIKLFWENYKYIKNSKYRFMLVAQHSDFEEFVEMVDFICSLPEDLPLCIGIPKLSCFRRSSKKAIKQYKRIKFPIHFLGIKSSFSEVLPVLDIIRSCDSAQLFIAAKYNILGMLILDNMETQLLQWRRPKHMVVDLEADELPEDHLILYRKYLENALR